MANYDVNVNDTFHFELAEANINRADIISVGAQKFHLLHENNSYTAEIHAADFLSKQYTVHVNGNNYVVNIQNPLDILIKQMGFEVGAGKQINAINAPMPGLILDISIEPGQSVLKNDPLLILGAMKMENSFLSPRDGVIKSILVKIGDAVDKGQLLIEFE